MEQLQKNGLEIVNNIFSVERTDTYEYSLRRRCHELNKFLQNKELPLDLKINAMLYFRDLLYTIDTSTHEVINYTGLLSQFERRISILDIRINDEIPNRNALYKGLQFEGIGTYPYIFLRSMYLNRDDKNQEKLLNFFIDFGDSYSSHTLTTHPYELIEKAINKQYHAIKPRNGKTRELVNMEFDPLTLFSNNYIEALEKIDEFIVLIKMLFDPRIDTLRLYQHICQNYFNEGDTQLH